ncbi:MAG: hypothetical protein V7K89_22920 [Nostoc sp.]|uniref:hypothetical protein n=1 Tax=Nostoc sp. TaxID=1180 RepID=UPI002FF5BA2B
MGKRAAVTSGGRAYTPAKTISASYQDLHYRYGLQTAVNAAFGGMLGLRKPWQELELNLILKWRSPFNKENWERWGQPFG